MTEMTGRIEELRAEHDQMTSTPFYVKTRKDQMLTEALDGWEKAVKEAEEWKGQYGIQKQRTAREARDARRLWRAEAELTRLGAPTAHPGEHPRRTPMSDNPALDFERAEDWERAWGDRPELVPLTPEHRWELRRMVDELTRLREAAQRVLDDVAPKGPPDASWTENERGLAAALTQENPDE